MGTLGGGLFQFHPDEKACTYYIHDADDPGSISNNWISSIVEDQHGIIWIGTYGGGLNRFEPKTGTFQSYKYHPSDPFGITDDVIMDMILDPSGLLWIATANGVDRSLVDRINFRHYYHIPFDQRSLSDDLVRAILEDHNGVLWVGTAKGLDCIDRGMGSWMHYQHDPANPGSLSGMDVRTIFEDGQGRLWIGTNNGIDLFDRERNQFIQYTDHTTFSMMQDRMGKIWVTAAQGVYLFDPDADNEYTLIRDAYAWKISVIQDRLGFIWVGTAGDGIEKYDPRNGIWQVFEHDPDDSTSISNDFIECILEDHLGNLWFATGGGLNRFFPETETFINYRVSDGLPHDWVSAVLEDEKGFLWLNTTGGISRFDPNTETFVNFLTDSKNKNPSMRGSYFQAGDGEIFFGGVKGLNAFYPGQIALNTNLPQVIITGISLFNEKISKNPQPGKQIELDYDKNFLSFDFTAMDFTEPERNQFACMMVGLDDNWVYTGNRKHIDYPDLKPGDYTFRVKASNNDGMWNEKGTFVDISVTPPFWKTWWFRIVFVLIIVTMIYLIFKRRIAQIETKKQELEKRVKERTEAANRLQNALDEVELLKNRLQTENVYLQDEIRSEHNFENIITHSNKFKKILHSVEQVASTDATVLILGESGTGKELVARAVHNISNRSKRPLIKVNCAVLPEHLIESELFGHEKGAFTGAIAQKSGRFELADGGTIFLDEIGELHLDLQVKLLRVLQEGEFERLGNPRTLKVDVRVIAATNRDLQKEVQEGRFREDLYYRLNVFPILIPPLRDRKEDIPLLVNHFIQKFSTKVGKKIDSVSKHLLNTFKSYHWPGNVRELENVIERSVIVSRSNKLVLSDWISKEEKHLKSLLKSSHLSNLKKNIYLKCLR